MSTANQNQPWALRHQALESKTFVTYTLTNLLAIASGPRSTAAQLSGTPFPLTQGLSHQARQAILTGRFVILFVRPKVAIPVGVEQSKARSGRDPAHASEAEEN